jgi:hypothetical protein
MSIVRFSSWEHQQWRLVGRYLDIQSLGRLHSVEKTSDEALDGHFWRWLWMYRMGGREFKNPARCYKTDIFVHKVRDLHRYMRKCTAIGNAFDSFDEAHGLKTRLLERCNAQMSQTMKYLQRSIANNSRELTQLYAVPRRIRNVLDAMEAHGTEEDLDEPWAKRRRLGPMRTMYKRINATLAIKKQQINWW